MKHPERVLMEADEHPLLAHCGGGDVGEWMLDVDGE